MIFLSFILLFVNIVFASEADNWFFNAQLHLEDGRKDKAVECLEKTIQLNPDHSKARNMLIELTKGDKGNSEFLSDSPKNNIGKSDFINTSGTGSSGNRSALDYLKNGNKLALENNFLSAIDNYKLALKNDTKLYSARINLGYCYEKTGMFLDAIKEYKRILVFDKNNSVAHNNLGFLYAHINDDLDTALQHCSRAVEIEPQNSNYIDSLGYVYLKKKQFDRADGYFDKSLEQDSGNTSALRHKALSQYLRGNMQKAIELYEDCLKTQKEAETYLQLAVIYVDTGQAEQALSNLGKCIEKSPYKIEALFYLGFVYLSMGDARSSEFFSRLEKINPKSAEADMAIALPLAMSGATGDTSINEKIQARLSSAIEKKPSWWMPYFFLATNYIENKNKNKALEIIKKGREISPVPAQGKMDSLEQQAKLIVSGILYENKANSFSVYYPDSWTMTEDTAQMNLAQAQVVFSKKDEAVIVAVIIQPNTSGYNLNTIVEYKRANLSAYQPGYKEIEVKDVSYPNFTGAMIIYSQQGNSQIAQVFATIDKRILAIAYIDSQDNFKQNYPDFESILKTFKLNY
jgi:tetratricopeptide (TPR) repeat protein